jgi:hypothetical protein
MAQSRSHSHECGSSSGGSPLLVALLLLLLVVVVVVVFAVCDPAGERAGHEVCSDFVQAPSHDACGVL